MHYAIISDLHANEPALREVFKDIEERGIRDIICLGDIVGYGPDPLPCLDLVMENCFKTLRGNHDDALVNGAKNFTQRAKDAIDWTREVIKAAGEKELRRRRVRFLQELPLRYERNGILFVHGSPRDPVSEYLFSEDCARDPDKIKAAFEGFGKVCFVGHTHMPGVFLEDVTFKPASEFGDDHYHFKRGEKAIINVGSVGQPRDKDQRACYVEVAKNKIYFRRVAYDVEATVAKIKANERLADSLGIRLKNGV